MKHETGGFTAHTSHSVTNCALTYEYLESLVPSEHRLPAFSRITSSLESGVGLSLCFGIRETKKPHQGVRLSVGTEPAFCTLLWWHSDAAVQSNDFCIHVGVGDAVDDREREFLSATQTLGE